MPILYSPEHNRAVIDGYDDAARQGIAALLTAALPGVRIVREEDDASDWFDISDPESLDEAAPQKDDSDEDDGKKPPEKGKKAPPFGKKKDDAEDEPSDPDLQALDGQQEPGSQGDYVPTLADVQTAYDVMYARGLHDDDIAEKIYQRFGLQLELDPMGRVLWVPGMADMPMQDAPELKPKIGLQQGHELDFNRVATQGKPTKDDKQGQAQQPAESVHEADINPWLWDRYLNKPDKGRRSDRVHVTRTSLTPGKGHPLTHKQPRTSFEREMKMPAHQPERVRWMWHPKTGEMRISHAEEDHHATMLDAGENKHYDQWVRGYYFPKHRKVLIRSHPNPGVGEHLVGLLKPHLPASTTYRTNVSTANLQGVDGFARRGF